MEHSRSRSLEEENELARSTKKVKDSYHSLDDRRASQGGEASQPSKLSFKDKLVGEIPGAYSQAFVFTDQMEADSDSDEELEEIREGFASVCLSKETKQRIWAPWTNVIIVKVFGKKFDEDLEAVLKKGPWFVGGHFLSIRKWEVNFKPLEASVSSVAVWVRLNELPLEYYEATVLRQIG
nr:hypothetical protein CFP56_67428 [Quercus suber]